MHEWPLLEIPVPGPETAALAAELGIAEPVAQLLINRQLDASTARQMLAPVPPLDLPSPDFAAELQACFLACLEANAPVAIFGDYDADGLSGTAVLSCFLRQAGFDVLPVLPTRSQGYGLNAQSIAELAAAGARLLVTVDCGISNRAEIAEARAAGLQVVITDHHGLPAELPEAEFTLHPALLDLPELEHFSGAGMAWWLTTLLQPVLPQAPDPESLLDLAVLGALADMTPLIGPHFALAKRGLQAMRQTLRPGLLALARQKQIDLPDLVEDDLTFRMIPLLNAAGRLGSPQPALELLLSEDAAQAATLAEELAEINTRRQQLCEQVLEQALELLADQPLPPAIVLADARWPHGVLGITCSQLVARYHVPVVLLAIEGEVAKASIRAPKGYHVLQALQACDALLIRYGGHEMAGGLSVSTTRLKEFSAAFMAACEAQQARHLQKVVSVEMTLAPEDISLGLWESLRQLAPFGMGNPAPVFLSSNIPLKDVKPDRKSGTHFFAALPNGVRVKGWQLWDPALAEAPAFDLLYSLERQTWRKQTKVELTLQALRPHAELKSAPAAAETVTEAIRPRKPQRQAQPLPGYFSDGSQIWQLRFWSDSPPPVWLDARQGALPPGVWLRPLDPLISLAEATVQQGQAEDFAGLALARPPWHAALLQGFRQIALLPLAPLPPALSFDQLLPILTALQDHPEGSMDAAALQTTLKSPHEMLEICLNGLSELGLLTYDSERYAIQYTNQRYDLRQSKTFQNHLTAQQARAALAAHWPDLCFERLKNCLQSGTRPC